MLEELWKSWTTDWKRVEAIARRRDWEVTPLALGKPASADVISRAENAQGIPMPWQLRSVLEKYAGRVQFGWSIPSHLEMMEPDDVPTASANLGDLWDIDHIVNRAIPNFLGWKQSLANTDLSEAPNSPEMWEDQFALWSLPNGDMVTIDCRNREGPQPVQYLSHELEMLHGLALAPDFFSFVTEMSKLGFAGTEWAGWMRFGAVDEEANTYFLDASSAGARSWLAWMNSDPDAPVPDQPPKAIIEKTVLDRNMLVAARAGRRDSVLSAIAEGATPDAVWNSDWISENMAYDEEFSTALCYAARHNDLDLIDALLGAGATLNTRRLPVADAVEHASAVTLQRLIKLGARVNGWKGERYFPLVLLVDRRSRMATETRDELERRLREDQGEWESFGDPLEDERTLEADLRKHVTPAEYLSMLEMLLQAGADPDARWDNGITMLGWGGTATAKLLLKYGADVHVRDLHGWTVLHTGGQPEKLRLLVEHGADIDAAAVPDDDYSSPYTALQSELMSARNGLENARTLLELGADPNVRSGDGRNTLFWCTTIEGFELMREKGLDPLELRPDGGTLLHNIFELTSVRASFPEEVAFFDHLLALPLDINAQDKEGRTALHIAAGRTHTPDDLVLLIQRGADATIRDGKGKCPIDHVPRSLKGVRAVLKT